MSAKTKNQKRYDDLSMAIKDMGNILWENQTSVRLYPEGHLEISADGYIKYEFRGCDTSKKILDSLRVAHDGIIDSIKARQEELSDALSCADSSLLTPSPEKE